MQPSLDIILCALLRVGLGLTSDFPYTLSDKEWQALFLMAKQQTVQGVAFDAIPRLPAEKRPPRLLVMKLAGPNEIIHGVNKLMNQEAARYTKLFAERGVRSVILKGQANARLYPDPSSRQAGDIDIWVPGGYDKVERLLLDMGLITEGKPSYKASRHIGFRNEKGIEIEVHHRPTEIFFKNKELQEFFLSEFENSSLTPEGFFTPSIRFALVMQLHHLYHHCIREGVGLRHFMDYFILITHSTEDDRKFVWNKIQQFGLDKACTGTMWMLEKMFGLQREMMLCPPDRKRGIRLYNSTIAGGNFGRNVARNKGRSLSLNVWLKKKMHILSWFFFDPRNTISGEIFYWKEVFSIVYEHFNTNKLNTRRTKQTSS